HTRIHSAILSLQRIPHNCTLHSFPTRRSSDLEQGKLAMKARPAHRMYLGRVVVRLSAISGAFRANDNRTLSAFLLQFHSVRVPLDRKSTRLNSSHRTISYAVFCLKKKNDRDYN